jgi:hypothetical protein
VAYDFDGLFDEESYGGYASSYDFDGLFDEPEEEEVNFDYLFEPQEEPIQEEPQPVAEEPRPGFFEEGGKALVSGTINTAKSPNTLLKMFGNQIESGWLERKLGLDKAGKALADYADENIKALDKMEKPFEQAEVLKGKNIVDNPELLKEPLWWARGLGELVPSLAATIIPAAQAGKAVESAAIAAKAAPHVVRNLANLGAQLTGGAVGATLESTNTYEDVLKETGDHSEALKAAGLFAPSVFALSAFSSGKLLERAGKGLMAKLAKRGMGGLVEGFTEGAEEPTEVASKLAAKIIEGKPLPEDVQGMFIQSFKDALTVAPLAAITGMGASGNMSASEIDEIAKVNPKLRSVAEKTSEVNRRLEEADLTKEATEVETEINNIVETTKKLTTPDTLQDAEEQRMAEIGKAVDDFNQRLEKGEVTTDDMGDFISPEDLTAYQEYIGEDTAEKPSGPPESTKEEEPISKYAFPDINETLAKLPEGTTVKVQEQDMDTGEVSEVETNAAEELKKTDDRYQALTKIMDCLG